MLFRSDIMFENLMNRFSWGNAEVPGVYLDETNRRMFSNYRRTFGSLALALIAEGDTVRALEACRGGIALVPRSKMDYDYFMADIATALIKAGEKEEGIALLNEIVAYSKGYLEYMMSIPQFRRFGLEYPIGINLQSLIEIYNRAFEMGLEEIRSAIEPDLNRYYSELVVSAPR